MKTGFFLKLARSNISKNRRFFLPRILSEAGLLCVFYIVFTLRADERILQLRGGQYIEVFMSIGVAVMMLLSVILLFYINSFLMKQRKREFGVYNILGLEKRHICRVLFHETALCSLASVVLGLAIGVLFYKLCSLLICQLLNAEIVLGFYFINARSLALSGAFFLVLDVMAYGVNCVTIARLKPVELLSSANVGEREPKVKWPLLVLGLLALDRLRFPWDLKEEARAEYRDFLAREGDLAGKALISADQSEALDFLCGLRLLDEAAFGRLTAFAAEADKPAALALLMDHKHKTFGRAKKNYSFDF